MKAQVQRAEFRQVTSHSVPAAGYRWVGPGAQDGNEDWEHDEVMDDRLRGTELEREALDRNPPWLVGGSVDIGDVILEVRPLPKDRILHRTLARVDPSDSEILGLATAYGNLFGDDLRSDGVVYVRRISGRDNNAPRSVLPAVSLERWRHELRHIRTAVYLWDLCGRHAEEPDVRELRTMFVQRRGHLFFRQAGMTEGWVAPEQNAATLRRGEEDDVDLKEAALLYVAQLVNKNVGRAVSPMLVRVDPGRGQEWETELRPRNLLGAAWLDLYQDVAGKTAILQCPECLEWFDATRHPRQVYCHNRGSGCRKKASRQAASFRIRPTDGPRTPADE